MPQFPTGSGDELGTLLSAMGVMRNNIRAMVEREVSQRRSAEARLADALESSREGIVVLDANGQIALANSRASELLQVSPQLLGCELVQLQLRRWTMAPRQQKCDAGRRRHHGL